MDAKYSRPDRDFPSHAMRVVVIGATGHIGTWLVPRLVRAGHDVVSVSRGSRTPYHESDEWRAVNAVVLDRLSLERENAYGARIAALEPDVVVDLICFDVHTARQLVDGLRGRVQLFLHCGTLWVHGVPRSCPYDETVPRVPFGDYGIRKAEIERYLLEQAENGFPASLLHPGHISGPGWAPINPAGNLDVRVFEKLATGETVVLPDDGMARLQHVHADDVAQAFALAVERPDRAIGNAFHVAARQAVPMRDHARAAASWFGRAANLAFEPLDEWAAHVSPEDARITRDHVMHSPCASIEKARAMLGFEPRYTAVEAVREAVVWLADHGRLSVRPTSIR
jgi:nucleoside-diphosphate-sugar epimerase